MHYRAIRKLDFTKNQRMKGVTFCFIFLITFFNTVPSKNYLVEVNDEKGSTNDKLFPASSDKNATIESFTANVTGNSIEIKGILDRTYHWHRYFLFLEINLCLTFKHVSHQSVSCFQFSIIFREKLLLI